MNELLQRVSLEIRAAVAAHRPTWMRRLASVFLLANPFLMAVVPIVHLYSQNLGEADIIVALIFSGGALAITTIVFLVSCFWQRNWTKAALMASLFNCLFFAYGRMFDCLMRHEPIKMPYEAWHMLLASLCVAILLALGSALRRTSRNLRPLSQFLSGALSIFVLICVARVGGHLLQMRSTLKHSATSTTASSPADFNAPRIPPLPDNTADTPDVYYIILDGYARADVLQRVCGCDNSKFLDFLRSRGFYVAEQSSANYPMTFVSIASSLNMKYMDDELKSPDYSAVYASWNDPLVARVFQSKGYRFVYMATNFRSTLDGADFVFQQKPSWLLNQFAEVQLRDTALRFFESQMAEQHLYQFESLKQVARIQGPTFTFCHLIAPHPPYVFDREGHVRSNVPQSMFFKDGWEQQQNPSSQAARQAYVEQLLYVNSRMEEIIDSIVARSTCPPIIIIQGDHGTFFTLPSEITDESLDRFAQERLPVLNAYLVPEEMRSKLRPDISPVNSFRMLFNECFGEHFGLLPEKHLTGWYYGMRDLRDATRVVHSTAIATRAAQPKPQ